MKHEPGPDQTTAPVDVPIQHELHRDYETRSKANLKKVGLHVYANDPTTEIICIAFAVDDGPVQRWFPGDPIPEVWFEAAANLNWTATAHNDPFESAIEEHKLHPLYGFPLIPMERHRCTQAAALALALPPKLALLADAMGFANRKDAAGERLMHQMTKPRKPRKDEDPDGVYWHEDGDKLFRLSDYNCTDVEVEREAGTTLPPLSDTEQKVWLLSNQINRRGFHIDRPFAEAACKIAQAAGPEIDAELTEITGGAVKKINQIQKMKDWLKAQGCETPSLDSETIEKLLEDENLAAPVRRVLELRAGGAQAAVKKIGALLARADTDDRIRGAFKYHGASTGRWAGEGYQPQNLKRPEVEDLDAAIAAVMTGDYALMKQLYPKPLSVVGDCSRAMITAADDYELIGADLSSIESRAAAWVAGEEWKLDAYRKYDVTGDPRDEPYVQTAVKVLRLNSPDNVTKAQRKIGKTCDLAFNYAGGLGAWRNFDPDRFTDEEVETFKQEWRANHPKIVQYWHSIDRAAVGAVYEPGVEIVCGPVVLVSDDKFLRIRLPSGRDLSYPNPRLIVDDRDNARVVYDDNGGGRFAPCRGGFGAYSGIWFENIVSGISRDILVEAMFRIEAAGLPIVLHIHDECVCEVPIGSGDEQEFVRLMTQPPSWASDLPIAANAWRGYRYDKSEKSATGAIPKPAQPTVAAVAAVADDEAPAPNGTTQETSVDNDDDGPPIAPNPQPSLSDDPAVDDDGAVCDDNGRAGISVSFTRFEAHGERLSKLYKQAIDGKVFKLGGTQMSRGVYETITIEAANTAAVLAEVGSKIDVLNFREAIGLGVIKDGHPSTGDIITKNLYERVQTNPRATRTGIPRALSHFDWPSSASSLLLFDGDEKDNLREILTALWPDFVDVACLVRPSASASVKDPATGERLKAGEHLFVLLDEPAKAKACLVSILRLSWCVGVGRSAGWLGLAKDGDPLVYGPCDVTVGSPERLVYEGEVSLDKGLERLPRNSTVIGGSGVLCAAALIAFADQHAPVKQFNELVAAAKNDPAFLAQQAAVKAAYRVDHIEKGVAQGKPKEEVGREFDRVTRSSATVLGTRIWRELSPHQTLYFPDGRPFLASEMGADPKAFHGRECADPVEGLDYQSRNPGLILHQGGRVEIYSRAHSDRYAYFLPLYTTEGLGELLKSLGEPDEGASASVNAEDAEAKAKTKKEANAASGDKGAGTVSASVNNTMSLADQIAREIAHGVDGPDDAPHAVDDSIGCDAAFSLLDEAKLPKGSTDLVVDVGGLVVLPPNGGGGGGSGSGSGGGSSGGGGGSPGPRPGFFGKTKRIIKYGPLSYMADCAAEVLLDEGVPFYQRGRSLVRPVVRPVQTFDGKMTTAAQLVEVELPYLRDMLCQNSSWVKYDGRSRRWVDIHPPVEAAQVLLKRFGDWNFPAIAGIISTPTLRPDGTILSKPGYDPATQLLLIDPPAMPDIPEKPTREDALAKLELLNDLLFEFRFDDDRGVSRSVALSAIISTVCRGAYPVVPMHMITAPVAGSGKSYLLSTVSRIATGQPMPVIGAGKTEEELEKRLGAAVIHGQSLVCIDNVVGELGGDALCRQIEQSRPHVRVLGQSLNVEIDARSTTYFCNGNNIAIVGDLCRRVIGSRLDPQMERPELREFKGSPEDMVVADRGKYIAACLTICRAYIAAERPDKLPKLASFGGWSDTVRSALVWLGEADPVKSMDLSKAEDPETAALLHMLNEWKRKIGVGRGNGKQLREVINICDANKATPNGKEYINEGLRAAVLGVMPVQHHLKPDATALGLWLRSRKERRVGKLRFRTKPATGVTPGIWWVEEG